jgi:hypothetical protein
MTMTTSAEHAGTVDAVLPLAFPFTRGGYRHVLLGRVGLWCVLKRTWVGDGRPHLPHYEVLRLHREPARTGPDGQVIAAHEVYAVGAWGSSGWSEPTLVHARQRWERLRATPKGADLPAWSALGIMDDPEGYQAWKAGRLPRRETPPAAQRNAGRGEG